MPIHFSKDRMPEVLDAHERWWNGTLDRPLLSLTQDNAYDVPVDRALVPDQWNCDHFENSVEAVIDAADAEFSTKEFLADGFPLLNFSFFGPGVLAAFCGARLDTSSGRVWFFPEKEQEIGEIHAKYDPNNIYVRRIKDLYRAGLQKWDGSVILGMPDLGGVMDVAATLRGTENLLMDLIDEPEEVLRLIGEIETAWYDAYNDFSAVLAPQGAHSDWSGLLSRTPSYIVQCDFSYMIGAPMFRKFVLETLRKDTQILDHSIYHLDGIGQLNHLDDILQLPDLNAIQWVFGDGKPNGMHWLDVYAKIEKAGKGVMYTENSAQDMLTLLSTLHGTPYIRQSVSARDKDLAKALIKAR